MCEDKECPDCGEVLIDFKKQATAKVVSAHFDSEEEMLEFQEAENNLFQMANGGRRYYCEFCDLGFEEDEI